MTRIRSSPCLASVFAAVCAMAGCDKGGEDDTAVIAVLVGPGARQTEAAGVRDLRVTVTRIEAHHERLGWISTDEDSTKVQLGVPGRIELGRLIAAGRLSRR